MVSVQIIADLGSVGSPHTSTSECPCMDAESAVSHGSNEPVQQVWRGNRRGSVLLHNGSE